VKWIVSLLVFLGLFLLWQKGAGEARVGIVVGRMEMDLEEKKEIEELIDAWGEGRNGEW